MKCGERPFPNQIRKLAPDETFIFKCHPGVPCFNECCRLLDLALTPYDAMRLKNGLKISSAQFLQDYALIDISDDGGFPEVYLGMIDDGQGRCPFVTKNGCQVYPDRPAACRTYPLGRGVFNSPEGETKLVYVLLNEPHCKGFEENQEQNIEKWLHEQGLDTYNLENDKLLDLIQHNETQKGKQLTEAHQKMFIDTLYDLDGFREKIQNSAPEFKKISNSLRESILTDQVALLNFGIEWLKQVIFKEYIVF